MQTRVCKVMHLLVTPVDILQYAVVHVTSVWIVVTVLVAVDTKFIIDKPVLKPLTFRVASVIIIIKFFEKIKVAYY